MNKSSSMLALLEGLNEKYDHIDFTPPAGVRKAAERGLELLKLTKAATPVGKARARDLKNGKNLSPKTIKRMVSFFSRHEVDKDSDAWKNQTPSNPSRGYVAWMLWGGDPGFSWAKKVSKQMKSADERES